MFLLLILFLKYLFGDYKFYAFVLVLAVVIGTTLLFNAILSSSPKEKTNHTYPPDKYETIFFLPNI
jgi:hypothetical protein